jgi:hypothetical protein
VSEGGVLDISSFSISCQLSQVAREPEVIERDTDVFEIVAIDSIASNVK